MPLGGPIERALVLLVGVLVGGTGCAERFGRKAAAGAAEGLRRERADHPDGQPVRRASQAAVVGAMDTLDTPEQRERIQQWIAEAVSEATRTAVREATRDLVVALGPDGEGPLGASIAGAGERTALAAVAGARRGIADALPACDDEDPQACLRRRVRELAHASAIGLSHGLRESLGWTLILIAFALGAAGGVFGSWLWSLRSLQLARRVTKPA